MKRTTLFYSAILLAATCAAPLSATVTIVSLTPSLASPQPLGTVVTWVVKATDSNPGPLTFQFNVKFGTGAFAVVRDFNVGTDSAGTWTAQPFVWTTISAEGTYTIEVVAKDFKSGESISKAATYKYNTRVTGNSATVHKTAYPTVAQFDAPSCPAGSTSRVAFFTGANSPTFTNWVPCNPPKSINTYVAGMYPSTTYTMYAQTDTGGTITNGNSVSFTTSALPTSLKGGNFLPGFTVNTAASDTSNPMLLWSFTKVVVPVATDLSGKIVWYYSNPNSATLLTRPVAGGTMLTIQNGNSWDSSNTTQQILREIDLAGNIIHETNTGIVANQLVALGVTDATPCGQVVKPFKVGTGCLDDFHHDAIRLPNGDTAFLAHAEKLYPAGTQGHAGTALVDILSELAIVLDTNWQVKWYYDAFEQLNINRTAPLGESCSAGASDCPSKLTLATTANDWTHANTIDYVGSATNPDVGDFLMSVRNQDQIIRIHYENGAGSCAPPNNCIVWYMGPPDNTGISPSAFTYNNFTSDSWPWFSHQHDVNYANSGANVFNNLPLLTIFDNGNTRCSPPPLGLGSTNCYSRGMALEVDEVHMTVTPTMLQPLGLYSSALGGAELLPDNNYFFQTGLPETQAIELQPSSGVLGTQILNVQGSSYSYRGWQMQNLYSPPLQ